MATTIFWFRRDLRLDDNTGLYHALKEQGNVMPVFIFDRNILDTLQDEHDARITFICQALKDIQADLARIGSTLRIYHGKPVEIFRELMTSQNIGSVYANHDYEPYARERDRLVGRLLIANRIPFNTFKDQVIFEKDEVLKADGTPYTVYTPYMRKWKETLGVSNLNSFDIQSFSDRFVKDESTPVPGPEDLGFRSTEHSFPDKQLNREVIRNYHLIRDVPAISGTSRMSVHLRFGTVSIRYLVREAMRLNDKWLNELIWREFYMGNILWHFPQVVEHAFKPAYDRIPWINDPGQFAAWCKGQTGYPFVDAGMRELNTTGYMHNRVRMITASFLTKHLLTDWRWGEGYFARRLLDFELSSNNGGWQWAAGTGCDAAPYFRIFNPSTQALKFDPGQKYIQRWVPEYNDPQRYPLPIIEHAMARKRAIETYRIALRP